MRTKLILSAAVAALLVGCASTSPVRPYVGQQQAWPVAAGAVVEPNTEIPAYHGAPDRPYTVIGEMDVDAAQWDSVARCGASLARRQGADAIIVKSTGQRPGGSTGSSMIMSVNRTFAIALNDSRPTYRNTGTVTLIKWK